MGGLDDPIHLISLLALLLLVFGAKRLPEMGRSLGSGLRGFRDALAGDVSERRALEPHGTATAGSPEARATHTEAARSGGAGSGTT
jgi:sec-independent protein translocase protein TatA